MSEGDGAVDIATLGIAVDATKVNAASDGLDRLTESGTKAESATNSLNGASAELAKAQGDLAAKNNLLSDTQGKLETQLSATATLQASLTQSANDLAQANAKLSSSSNQAANAAKEAGDASNKTASATKEVADAARQLTMEEHLANDALNKAAFQAKIDAVAKKQAAKATEELASASGALSTASNEASEAIKKVSDSADKAGSSTKELGDKSNAVAGTVGDGFKQAGDSVGKFADDAASGIDKVGEKSSEIGNLVANGAQTAFASIGGIVGGSVGEILGGFTDIGQMAGEALGGIAFDQIASKLEGFKEGLGQGASMLAEQAEKAGEAENGLEENTQSVSDKLGEAKDQVTDAGEKLGELKEKFTGAAGGAAEAEAGAAGAGSAFEGMSLGAAAGAAGIALVVAALAAVLIAEEQNRQALENWQAVAAGTGRFAGQTAGQFEDMAGRVAAASNTTVGAARESVEAFARAGAESGQTIEALSSIVEDYARLAGVDAAQANTQLAESITDPAKAAESLNQMFGILTVTQLENIRTLQAQGDGAGATSILVKALTTDVNANKVAVGGLTGVMKSLSAGVSQAWNEFSKLSGAIDGALGAYNRWQRATMGGFGFFVAGGVGLNEAPKETAAQAAERQARSLARKNAGAAVAASEEGDYSNRGVFRELTQEANMYKAALKDNDKYHNIEGVALENLRRSYVAAVDTRNAYIRNGKVMNDGDIAHAIAVADVTIRNKNATREQRASAEADKVKYSSLGQVITAGERNQIVTDRLATATSQYTDKIKKNKDAETDRVGKHLSQLQAEVEGQRLINSSVEQGAGSELRATAAKAAATAMAGNKYSAQQAELEQTLQYTLALERFIGKTLDAVDASGKQLEAAKAFNAATASGKNAVDAAQDAKIAAQTMPIQEVLDELKAKGEEGTAAYKMLNEQLERLRGNLQGVNAETAKTAFNTASKRSQDSTALVTGSMEDIGKSPAQAAIDEARRRAEQDNRNAPASQTDDQDKQHIKDLEDAARATAELKAKQDAYNESLHATSDRLRDVQAEHQATGAILASAFGEVGQGIAGAINAIDTYRVAQQTASEQQEAELLKLRDTQQDTAENRARIEQHYASVMATSQINAIGGTISSLKGMFNEHSKGYRVLEAVERGIAILRAINLAKELAGSLLHIGMKTAETTASVTSDAITTSSSVAASTVKGAASTAAGAAKMFEVLGPFGFVAVAAMLALLVGLGGGGKGGGAGASMPTAGSAEPLSPVDHSNDNSLYSSGNRSTDTISSNNGAYSYAPNSATAGADIAVQTNTMNSTGVDDVYSQPNNRSAPANDNVGYNITRSDMPVFDNSQSAPSQNVSIGGDTYTFAYTIDARGSDDVDSIDDRIRATMSDFQEDTINKARLAVKKDNAADSTRQVIGRSA